jgi:hypothetical protein
VHEFSHNIMGALRTADPALFAEIQVAYDAAKAKGLYKDAAGREQYAINTVENILPKAHSGGSGRTSSFMMAPRRPVSSPRRI